MNEILLLWLQIYKNTNLIIKQNTKKYIFLSLKGKNPTHSPVNAVSRKWRASKGVDRLMPRLVGGMEVTHQLKIFTK